LTSATVGVLGDAKKVVCLQLPVERGLIYSCYGFNQSLVQNCLNSSESPDKEMIRAVTPSYAKGFP
jgi:hypothetical protein